jgi:hypothetical protein
MNAISKDLLLLISLGRYQIGGGHLSELGYKYMKFKKLSRLEMVKELYVFICKN